MLSTNNHNFYILKDEQNEIGFKKDLKNNNIVKSII